MEGLFVEYAKGGKVYGMSGDELLRLWEVRALGLDISLTLKDIGKRYGLSPAQVSQRCLGLTAGDILQPDFTVYDPGPYKLAREKLSATVTMVIEEHRYDKYGNGITIAQLSRETVPRSELSEMIADSDHQYYLAGYRPVVSVGIAAQTTMVKHFMDGDWSTVTITLED